MKGLVLFLIRIGLIGFGIYFCKLAASAKVSELQCIWIILGVGLTFYGVFLMIAGHYEDRKIRIIEEEALAYQEQYRDQQLWAEYLEMNAQKEEESPHIYEEDDHKNDKLSWM